MPAKTAYIWGSLSSFSAPLAVWLLENDWEVHIPIKSALHISLSPLDLQSGALDYVEKSFSSPDKFRASKQRLKFLDATEVERGTIYDIIVFCGLPPNFDEARVSRAPWAAEELAHIAKRMKGVPTLIISSLWAAIQADGAVPEEIEFERRKPLSTFEGTCQQYELKLLKNLDKQEAPWYIVRLPMISGRSTDGVSTNLSGVYGLIERVSKQADQVSPQDRELLQCSYDPDSTLWLMPVDIAVDIVGKLIEDGSRPRFCNLVSTQATLNREFFAELASSLGYAGAQAVEKDQLNLPRALKQMLHDNVQVKQRNLFEVLGRYQQGPILADRLYLEKLRQFGKSENWGRSHSGEDEASPFSLESAESYFAEFMPSRIKADLLRSLGACPKGICFAFEKHHELKYKLCAEATKASASKLENNNGQGSSDSTVTFVFNEQSFMPFVQKKMSLEHALLSKLIKVQGKPFEIFRACEFLKKFVRHNPFVSPVEEAPKEEPLKSVSK